MLIAFILIVLGSQTFGVEGQSIFPISLGAGSEPFITTLDNGDFLIAWSYHPSILLFNANGSLAKEIPVAASVGGGFIAALVDGTFVYVWSYYQNNQTYQAFAQKYYANGTESGAQITVDSGNLTNLNLLASSAVGLSDGGFVIVYDGERDDEKDNSGVGWGVYQSYGQVFNSDGTPRGGQFVLYEGYSNSEQLYPTVTSLDNEGFLALWVENNDNNLTEYQIYGQFYHSNGAKIGSTLVLDNVTVTQIGQASARLRSGDIVVAWQARSNSSSNRFQVFAQILKQNGTPKKNTFLVQTNEEADQYSLPPAVTVLNSGRFVISWASADYHNLYFQMYRSYGSPYQNIVTVNPSNMTSGTNKVSSVSSMKDGGFVITWNYCVDDCGIYAQRYDANGELVPFIQDQSNLWEDFEFDEI